MSRIRTIKPEFTQSESMGRLSRDARLLYILSWTLADDSGRLRGNSRMLASVLFPYDDDAPALADGWLAELAREKCVQVYEVDGTSYLQILKWLDHQRIDKPSASKIPEFVEPSRKVAKPRKPSWEEGKGKEGKGKEGIEGKEGTDGTEPLRASVPADPPVVAIGLVDGSEYGIAQPQVDAWSTAYPNVDVLGHLRAMNAWALANPAKRKTRKGVMAFCNRWLMREQDKCRVNGADQKFDYAALYGTPEGAPDAGH